MLIQRITFAVLGAVLYFCDVALGDEFIELPSVIGRDILFPMQSPTGVNRCIVTTNTGLEFALVPNNSERPPGITQNIMDEASETCGMTISPAKAEHRGAWTIQAFTESNGEEPVVIKRFDVQFSEGNSEIEVENEDEVGPQTEPAQKVDVFPSRTISIFSGNSMSLRLLNHYENLSSCIATSPDGHEFDVLNTLSQFSNDIRSFDQCGVTVRVNKNHTGSWQLNATIINNEMGKLNYFGKFRVLVRDSDTIYTEPTVTHVQRGASASIKVGPSEAISCQLRNPSGQDLPIQFGNCHIDIPIVTNVHIGYWTASYSLQGKVNVVEKVTEVVAYDDHSLNATVTTADTGEANLLCRVRAHSFSFCQFVKPDGTILNIFEGIGNDRYLYYGHGTQSTSMLTERIHECGITILKPDDSDRGTWKCILGTSSGLTGSMLGVTVPGRSAREDIVALSSEETVYVVKGDSFTVKCNANATLTYCWTGSPNGTAYSVSSTGISPTTLHYVGMGLSLGECGAVIPSAKDTDEGEWKCGMGVSNGQEIISIVRVIVTDTLLMPDINNVTVRHNQAQLSCSLIPGHEETINYCRWIKPNGFGVGQWANSDYDELQYITFSTNNSCHLEMKNMSEFWDAGNWTCVAGLVGSSLEVSAIIQVLQEPGLGHSSGGLSSWYFGLGLGMIAVIIATVLVVTVRAKLRSKEKTDLPPRYERNHKGMPPVTTPYASP